MRHNPSTVVVLAGHPSPGLLGVISRFMNVALVRPGDNEDAASALRGAAGISSPYVLVAADPLTAVAAEWQSLWQITGAPRGGDAFELRAGEVLASWRAGQFELPDYYLVLAEHSPAGTAPTSTVPPSAMPPTRVPPNTVLSNTVPSNTVPSNTVPPNMVPRPDFYLGPLRALRPHRVAVVAASETAEQAAGVLTALGSLRHGRWWPPLPEVIDSARGFYPGSLGQTPDGTAVPLLR